MHRMSHFLLLLACPTLACACAGPQHHSGPSAEAMAGTLEPVSSTVVDKVEVAGAAAHEQGIAAGMDSEAARCVLC